MTHLARRGYDMDICRRVVRELRRQLGDVGDELVDQDARAVMLGGVLDGTVGRLQGLQFRGG